MTDKLIYQYLKSLGFFLLTSSLFVACSDEHQALLDAEKSGSTETNSSTGDLPEFNERIQYQGLALAFSDDEGDDQDEEDSDLSLKYLVSAEPPRGALSDRPLQATSFDISNSLAAVSYAQAGEIIEGAIDIVEINGDRWANIISSLSFKDAEFADIAFFGSYLVAVGAESNAYEGAVLVILDIKDLKNPQEISRLALPSHYATEIEISDRRAIVSTGDQGGVLFVTLSDPFKPSVESQWELPSALSLGLSGDDVFVLGGKEKSTIYRIDNELQDIVELSEKNLQAPARMKFSSKYLYSNADSPYFKIYEMKKNEVKDKLSEISISGTGNGLDISDKYAFLAQGESGLVVLNINNPKRPYSLGSIDFPDDRGSANQVRYGSVDKKSVLFLADGLGGFRVISMQTGEK